MLSQVVSGLLGEGRGGSASRDTIVGLSWTYVSEITGLILVSAEIPNSDVKE